MSSVSQSTVVMLSNTSQLRGSDTSSMVLMQYFHLVIHVIIGGLLSLFGVVTNILNIIVFVKQGFMDSNNISLFGLAVADLLCVLTTLWTSIASSPMVLLSAAPFNGFDVSYMTGAWPHVCFNRIASFITSFITVERCLCIAMPLKIKNTLTPLVTKIIVLSIFVFMFIIFSPFYFVNSLNWIYYPNLNRSLLTLVYSNDRVLVETVTFPIHSVAVSVMSLVCVIVCTIILVISLNKKSKWRHKSVANRMKTQDTTSLKDNKVVKMVIFISTIFIICYSPATIIFLIMAYEPEFSFSGKYVLLFFILWYLILVLETVSSSVNIFVYFCMSTKFRTTFIQTFLVFS